MGKIILLIHKIHEMPDIDLFNRFKKIVNAQAIREYLGTKEDQNLSLEVNLAGEEILRRMAVRDPIFNIKVNGKE